jgi:hypothetical protein
LPATVTVVSRRRRVGDECRPVRPFLDDYPMSEAFVVCGGMKRAPVGAIEGLPIHEFLSDIENEL